MNNSTTNPLKQCSKCHEYKPATTAYFYKKRNALHSRCKACLIADYPRLRPLYPPVPEGQKRCSKCHLCFPSTPAYFCRYEKSKDGLVWCCRSCSNKHLVKPRKIYPMLLPGFKRCGHCKIVKPANDTQFHRNKSRADGFDNFCKDCASQVAEKRRRSQPDHVRTVSAEKYQRRRARELNLPFDFTKEDWRICKEYFSQKCATCRKQTSRLVRDHWVSLVDNSPSNPGYTKTNIAPLCRSCNSSKSDREATEWLVHKFGRVEGLAILARITAYFEWVRQQD